MISTKTDQALTVHALRLSPGADLKDEIKGYAVASGIKAAVVLSAVGSLSVANLRYAGMNDAASTTEDLEILSIGGTISQGGEVHFHMAVARADGSVLGGHLLSGSVVRTTAEVVLGELRDVTFERAVDPGTGYRELFFR